MKSLSNLSNWYNYLDNIATVYRMSSCRFVRRPFHLFNVCNWKGVKAFKHLRLQGVEAFKHLRFGRGSRPYLNTYIWQGVEAFKHLRLAGVMAFKHLGLAEGRGI